jgi:hypothetical protein
MTDTEPYLSARCSSCRQVEAVLVERGATGAKRDLCDELPSADELAILFGRIGRLPGEMRATRNRHHCHLGLAGR